MSVITRCADCGLDARLCECPLTSKVPTRPSSPRAIRLADLAEAMADLQRTAEACGVAPPAGEEPKP